MTLIYLFSVENLWFLLFLMIICNCMWLSHIVWPSHLLPCKYKIEGMAEILFRFEACRMSVGRCLELDLR
jgi:hypothetical protein